MSRTNEKYGAHFTIILATGTTWSGGIVLTLDSELVDDVPEGQSVLVGFQSAVGATHFAKVGPQVSFPEVAFAIYAVAAGL